jgi:chromatin remodeling complex protein RSC6
VDYFACAKWKIGWRFGSKPEKDSWQSSRHFSWLLRRIFRDFAANIAARHYHASAHQRHTQKHNQHVKKKKKKEEQNRIFFIAKKMGRKRRKKKRGKRPGESRSLYFFKSAW